MDHGWKEGSGEGGGSRGQGEIRGKEGREIEGRGERGRGDGEGTEREGTGKGDVESEAVRRYSIICNWRPFCKFVSPQLLLKLGSLHISDDMTRLE